LQFDWLGSCPWPSAQISLVNWPPPLFLHFKSGAVLQSSIQINPNRILGIGFQKEFDAEALGERLRKMTDAELLRSGKAAKFMCNLEQTSRSRRESVL